MNAYLNPRGIALSVGACANGWPLPAGRIYRDSGDYAATPAGRIRRNDRRNAAARKRAWLEG